MEKRGEAERVCPECGEVNNPYDNYCSQCGYEFPPSETDDDEDEDDGDDNSDSLEVNPY